MRWNDHFAIGAAGTFVLYLLAPDSGERVYVVMSMETDEPVKWICLRQVARAWLVNETLMSPAEVDHAMWGADEWFQTKLRQASGSRPPVRGGSVAAAAPGQRRLK